MVRVNTPRVAVAHRSYLGNYSLVPLCLSIDLCVDFVFHYSILAASTPHPYTHRHLSDTPQHYALLHPYYCRSS